MYTTLYILLSSTKVYHIATYHATVHYLVHNCSAMEQESSHTQVSERKKHDLRYLGT